MDSKKLTQKIFNIMSYIIKKEMHPKNTVTFFSEVDCTEIDRIRHKHYEENHVKPSYTSFIVQAVSQAMTQHPYVNARIFPGVFQNYIHKFDNIDIAVANEKDFHGAEFFSFIDIIRSADQTSLLDIQQQLAALAKSDETNNEQLRDFMRLAKNFPSWLGKRLAILPTFFPKLWKRYRGAAVLISSPAKYGVDCVGATWPHPVGISFGLVKEKPMVKGGELQPVLSFTLTLNFDRRIIAGAPAARFFNQIVQNLTNPVSNFDTHVNEIHAWRKVLV